MSKRLTALTLVLLLIVTAAVPAFASDFTPQESSGTWVDAYVTPAAVLAGDVFELGIEVDNVEDLYGYSIEIKFDEYVVDISDWQGNLLHNDNSDMPFNSENPLEGVEHINRIDEGDTDEHLTYAVTKTDDVSGSDFVGEDGYAELAYLYFKVDSSMTGGALPFDCEFTVTGDRTVYDSGQANVLVELSDSNGEPIAFQTDPSSSVAYMYNPNAPTGEITLEWSGTPGYDLDAFFNINDTEYGWYNAGKLEADPFAVYLGNEWAEDEQDTVVEKFYYTQITPDSYYHVDLFDVDDLSQNTGSITVTIDDYNNNALDQTFSIANATGDSTDVWEVFSIDQSGNIVAVNELTNYGDDGDDATMDAPTITALDLQTDTVWNDSILYQSELTRDLSMDIELPSSVSTGYYDDQNQHFVGDVVVLDINDSLENDLFNTHEALTVNIVSGEVATVEMLLDELNGIFENGETYKIKAWVERYSSTGEMEEYSNDSTVVEFVYTDDGGGNLPPGTVFTDGDVDHVYFEGDNLAFTISDGFLPPGNDPDLSNNFNIVLFDNEQDVEDYSTTAFTNGTFTHNAEGTVSYSGTISGSATITTPGAIGVCFTPPEQAPPIAWPLVFSDNDNTNDFALAGIEIPDGDVSASPALSAMDDLYDTEQEITFTISTLGSVSFGAGLDIIHDREDLMNLPTAVTMGTIQDGSRYVEVDPASVAFLVGESATVTMNNITFSAVDIYEETSQNGDLVDNISLADGTLVFDVAHFSRYIVSEDTGELSDNATVTSTEYTVDNAAETISGVPFGTELTTFVSYLVPANGASYEVYQADGSTEATDLATDYKVVVTAEDGTTTKTYTVTVEQEQSLPVIEVKSVTGVVGQSVSVDVTMDEIPENWTSARIEFSYDSSKLTLADVENGDIFADPTINGTIPGTIVITVGETLDIDSGTKICTLTFDVNADAALGSTSIDIVDTVGYPEDSYIEDNDSKEIPVSFVDGAINIIDVMYGDVSGNGYVTAGDASLILQHLAYLITLDENQLQAADVSGNGYVTAGDASLILQKLAYLISDFPVNEN